MFAVTSACLGRSGRQCPSAGNDCPASHGPGASALPLSDFRGRAGSRTRRRSPVVKPCVHGRDDGRPEREPFAAPGAPRFLLLVSSEPAGAVASVRAAKPLGGAGDAHAPRQHGAACLNSLQFRFPAQMRSKSKNRSSRRRSRSAPSSKDDASRIYRPLTRVESVYLRTQRATAIDAAAQPQIQTQDPDPSISHAFPPKGSAHRVVTGWTRLPWTRAAATHLSCVQTSLRKQDCREATRTQLVGRAWREARLQFRERLRAGERARCALGSNAIMSRSSSTGFSHEMKWLGEPRVGLTRWP